MSEREEVATFVETWRRLFEASDSAALKALWDQSRPCVTYQPTEMKTAMTSFAQICDYYDQACGVLDTQKWGLWDLVIDVITPELAFARASIDMYYRVIGFRDPTDDHYWPGRVAMILSKVAGEWKLIHYEDSTLLEYDIPVIQIAQRPDLQQCVDAIENGDAKSCVPILQKLLAPFPPFSVWKYAPRPEA